MPKISAMTPATTITSTDIVAGVVSGVSKSITAEQILMTKSLTATRYEDLRVPVTATKTGGSKEPNFIQVKDNGSGSQGVFAYAFDKTSEEELYFTVQIPHDFKMGTQIEAHVHWAPVDTDTGTIQWGLEYTFAEAGSVFGDTNIILSTATAAGGIAYAHTYLDIDDIDTSAITTLSPMMLCRIYRNVAVDTYNNDALLLEIDFHYERDSLGSATETVK